MGLVVGMSLGGLTATRLSAVQQDLVARLALVDVTPGVAEANVAMSQRQRGAVALASGPYSFDPRDRSGIIDGLEVLWDDISALTVPLMLVRGADSAFVRDTHEAELVRRRPGARIQHVADAGHAVQSDQPRALASLLASFLDA